MRNTKNAIVPTVRKRKTAYIETHLDGTRNQTEAWDFALTLTNNQGFLRVEPISPTPKVLKPYTSILLDMSKTQRPKRKFENKRAD